MNKTVSRRIWTICSINLGSLSEPVSRFSHLHRWSISARVLQSTWSFANPPPRRLGITRDMSTMKPISSYPRAKSDEVIDDSEPEREEARKRRREEKQRRSGKSRSPSKSVIVVTDYETTSPAHNINGPIILTSGMFNIAVA